MKNTKDLNFGEMKKICNSHRQATLKIVSSNLPMCSIGRDIPCGLFEVADDGIKYGACAIGIFLNEEVVDRFA
jgi:hypothetical protein